MSETADKLLIRISRALMTERPETPLSVLLRAPEGIEEERKTGSLDDQKTQSVLEQMGLKTGPLMNLVDDVITIKGNNLVAVGTRAGILRDLLGTLDSCRVKRAWLDMPRFPLLDESTRQIGCPDVHDLDYTGKDITVGILDSGVDSSLSQVDVKGHECFIEGEDIRDGSGHGTHVAGIVASRDDTYQGVAPDASLLSAKIFSNDGGPTADSIIAKGAKWLADNGAQLINASLGGKSTGPSLLAELMEELYKVGVLCVVAAGNEGRAGWGTVENPGCVEDVLTVGSITKRAALSDFSSRGPVLGMNYKPDLVAPGGGGAGCSSGIISLRSTDCGRTGCRFGDYHIALQGTSMATPHVTGAAAIALQLIDEEGRVLEGAELSRFVKHALVGTAVSLELDPMEQGTGLLNLPKAVKAIRNDAVPDEIERGPTRAPEREYTCGAAANISGRGAKSLKTIQGVFVLPVGALIRALIDSAGSGSEDALYAINQIVPFSVVRRAVYETKSAADKSPAVYLSTELRSAFSQFISEEVKKRKTEVDNGLRIQD